MPALGASEADLRGRRGAMPVLLVRGLSETLRPTDAARRADWLPLPPEALVAAPAAEVAALPPAPAAPRVEVLWAAPPPPWCTSARAVLAPDECDEDLRAWRCTPCMSKRGTTGWRLPEAVRGGWAPAPPPAPAADAGGPRREPAEDAEAEPRVCGLVVLRCAAAAAAFASWRAAAAALRAALARALWRRACTWFRMRVT